MTFQDFQQLCNQAASTSLPVSSPCPIVVGNEADPIHALIGDKIDHDLIVFRMTPDHVALQALYRSVMFAFDEPGNQTVIQPLTTGV